MLWYCKKGGEHDKDRLPLWGFISTGQYYFGRLWWNWLCCAQTELNSQTNFRYCTEISALMLLKWGFKCRIFKCQDSHGISVAKAFVLGGAVIWLTLLLTKLCFSMLNSTECFSKDIALIFVCWFKVLWVHLHTVHIYIKCFRPTCLVLILLFNVYNVFFFIFVIFDSCFKNSACLHCNCEKVLMSFNHRWQKYGPICLGVVPVWGCKLRQHAVMFCSFASSFLLRGSLV